MGRYLPIADYAVIGDCHTAALVSREGSIDWFCPGRFDWPAALCRLLDAGRGGYFQVRPTAIHTARRRYRGPTNVLDTVFRTRTGRVRLTDFMAIDRRKWERKGYDVGSYRQIVRLIDGIDGEVELEALFKPTHGYATEPTRLDVVPDAGALAADAGHWLTLAAPGWTLQPDGQGAVRAVQSVPAGQRCSLTLTYSQDRDAAARALEPADLAARLEGTLHYWQGWAEECTYRGPYRDQVVRSALTLKLLTYEPTGAIVAAPTTSLPERIGGVRNWDYRFSWLRDSSQILFALMTVGYYDEALDFLRWLRLANQRSRLARPQILYRVDGDPDCRERELPHLEGYRCSRPVRIGNGAADQLQLDVYGELLNAAAVRYRCGTGITARAGRLRDRRLPPPSAEIWSLLRSLVEQAAASWRQPDSGIWEVRGGPRPFLYSRLMCWVALDRGIRLARCYGLDAPLEAWTRRRRQIRRAILAHGCDRRSGAFVQSFDNDALDASALAIPRVGFLRPTDPRVLSTIERVKSELMENRLVRRYRTEETEDGLPDGEGAFVLCSFWLVDALALAGRVDEAEELFGRVIGYANDLGLLAEEVEPASGELLGNFPQGFSHLGLIVSAVNIAHARASGAKQQPTDEAARADEATVAAARAAA
ncbi:MAG TPA: glycoside hydrolase family 15 protein [Chloroflexota bacterium]